MKEEIVSFETSKLAKEKGFLIEPEDFYCIDYFCIKNFTNDWRDSINGYKVGDLIEGYYFNPIDNNKDIVVQAPTQSLLQKFIREKHEIHISIGYSKHWKGYQYTISDFRDRDMHAKTKRCAYTDYSTFESSLESALYEALKLIKS